MCARVQTWESRTHYRSRWFINKKQADRNLLPNIPR